MFDQDRIRQAERKLARAVKKVEKMARNAKYARARAVAADTALSLSHREQADALAEFRKAVGFEEGRKRA